MLKRGDDGDDEFNDEVRITVPSELWTATLSTEECFLMT
jgi:hypothetical protein